MSRVRECVLKVLTVLQTMVAVSESAEWPTLRSKQNGEFCHFAASRSIILLEQNGTPKNALFWLKKHQN